MPFTPFHMGPGAAIKGLLGPYFSLTVFGFSQVVIDLEPLVRVLRADDIYHGPTHTYLAALPIALVAALAGKPVCEWLLRDWNGTMRDLRLRWLLLPERISWAVAILSALIGTLSHVFFDSIMHSDIRPWLPFAEGNGLYGAVPIQWIHPLCLLVGGLGAMVILAVGFWRRWTIEID